MLIFHVLVMPAYSHEGIEITSALSKNTAAADVVFRGKVTAISYQMKNVPFFNGKELPFTTVTYQVDDVLKGSANSDEVTLSFLGGAVVDNDGDVEKYLTVFQFPEFDVGDEDILFVAHAGTSLCPLVDCRDGRLRLIDDKIYTEDGAPLLKADEEGVVLLGEGEEVEEIVTHKVFEDTQRLISDRPSKFTGAEHTEVQHFDVFSRVGQRLVRGGGYSDEGDEVGDYLDETKLTDILLSSR